jgi:hypothetical protein
MVVAPAKAGAHTAEAIRNPQVADSHRNNRPLGLWVPAYAGTTALVRPFN